METMILHNLIVSQGYQLIDDAWDEFGRRTYLHDADAGSRYVKEFAKILRGAGWEPDRGKLRSFHHEWSGELIELEPGGADTPGHLLHHMKPRAD
jgi:hypothetical protein